MLVLLLVKMFVWPIQGYSNITSAIVTSFMISKYKPYIVISVGATSISPNLHQGDLFIAERYVR